MDINVQPIYGAPVNIIDPYDAIEERLNTHRELININSEALLSVKGKTEEQEIKIKYLQKRLDFMYTWFSILAVAMSTALVALAFAVK